MEAFDIKLTVIVPIYNVEKYLGACLDSIVNQTIDKNQIEVLLINDGSPDNSISIMKEYAEKYPYMHVFEKENEGLAKTRNFGIQRAKGKYIMYLDSDDTIKADTMKEVTDFFDKHYDEIDLVDYKLIPIIDGEEGKLHHRYQRLTRSGVYDLTIFENAFVAQTNINIFVKNMFEDNVLFDTTPGFRHEDQKYCTQILQKKMKIGFCDKGAYYYRHQPGSIVRTYFYAYYIFETTMQFWENLFAEYPDEVPSYIQALYFNDISWKLQSNVLLPYHYSDEDFKVAKDRIIRLLDRVDDRTILYHPNLEVFERQFYINLKNNKDIKVLYGPERIVVTNHGDPVYAIKDFEITILQMKVRGNQVYIMGQVKSAICQYIEKPELLKIVNNDFARPESLDLRLSSHSYFKTKELTNRFWLFQLTVPIAEVNTLEFRVRVNDTLYPCDLHFHSRVAMGREQSRRTIIRGNMQFSSEGGTFFFKHLSDSEKNREMHPILKKYRRSETKRWMFRNRVVKRKNSGERIWLYHDCKGVLKDNGYYQFSYDLKKNDGISRFFVINEDDISKVLNEFPREERSHIIQFGSKKHIELFLAAEKVITAFIERENYHPLTVEEMNKFHDLCDEPDLYYLQHGVLHAHVPWKYSLDRVMVRKEIISTRFEQENLINNYRFDEDHLLACGMPRYDFIDDKEQSTNRILYAPSWRGYLMKREAGNWIPNDSRFLGSAFYKETEAFLNSEELQRILEENDLYLDFKLHPIMKVYQHLYDIKNPRVSLAESKVKDTQYKIFMTDFSSYVFDFVYLQRPIVYFLPDEDMFKSGMNDYREVDIPLENGFGDYVTLAEEACASIKKIAENDFCAEAKYKEKMETLFFYKDNNQRERIYEAIMADK